ncbi:MAG: NFACT family protein [Candidatus Cloacimonetes bacterium]|nr:NFACT family protein [Candidatus Cloacimonadota bacterium]
MEYTFLKLWFQDNKKHLIGRTVRDVYCNNSTYIFDLSSIQFVVSINGQNPLCFIAEDMKPNENKDNPLMLLLKQHLIKSSVKNVEIRGNDRVLILTFDKESFYGETSYYKLIIELIPRYENLILTRVEKERDVILDCHRRIHVSDSKFRQLYPGIPYNSPPVVVKPYIFSANKSQFEGLFPGVLPDSWKEFITNFSNAPKFLKYIFKSGMKAGEMFEFINIIRTTCEHWSEKSNIFYETKKKYLSIFKADDCLEMKSVNDAFAYMYEHEIVQNRFQQIKDRTIHSHELKKKKLLRTISQQKKDLDELKDAEHWQKMGELLKINLHKIKHRMKEIVVTDYFEDGNPDIVIPLKTDWTPQQNMAHYFKKYKKTQSGKKKLVKNIASNEKKLEKLEKQIAEIDACESVKALEPMLNEKESGSKKQKKAAPFRKFTISVEGRQWDIFVGRSGKENDELTLHFAKPNDWFFHTRVYHGSHIIIKNPTKLEHLPERLREIAAGIAAYYSKAKHSTKVPVDFTLVRHVTKPRKSAPGFVVYKIHKTVFVDPIDPRTMQL